MYQFAKQPYTDLIKTRPVEGKIYYFEYGVPCHKKEYKTGDKIQPQQDSIIMLIPKEETCVFSKENRQFAWFQCRICGKLAYGALHNAKTPRYNPCGCWKKHTSSETGKRTGKQNCQHFIDWARSEEGRKHSSLIGKTIGCNNIIYAQQYCREHPEIQSNNGKNNIKYALEGLKKWQQEHPEEVHKQQQKATEAANKWREEHYEDFLKMCSNHYNELRKSTKPSKGEQIVIDFLEEKGIKYQREYPIADLLGPHNKPRRLDFMLFNNLTQDNALAIEVNGAQHYIQNHLFEQTSKEILTIQQIDELKANWCERNNIPLYTIDARNLSTVLSQLQNIIQNYY